MHRMPKLTGRSDDMLIIRGVNVFPSQIEEQILSSEGLAPHYFVETSKQGALDVLIVNVEKKNFSTHATAAEILRENIQTNIWLSCTVRLHDTGQITRSESKAKLIGDSR